MTSEKPLSAFPLASSLASSSASSLTQPSDDLTRTAYLEAKKDWVRDLARLPLPPFDLDALMEAEIPEALPAAFEQEADRRAQAAAFADMYAGCDGLQDKEKGRFLLLVLAPIVLESGELFDADLRFVCRVLYLCGLYRHLGREFSPEWQEKWRRHLTKHWDEYKGEPISQKVLLAWDLHCMSKRLEDSLNQFVSRKDATETVLN